MKPKIMMVAIDATGDYTEELVNKAERIADIYYFNQNEVTHCCEFTPSYWLEYVTSTPQHNSEDDVEADWLYSTLQKANAFTEGCYVHCSNVDKNTKVKLLQDFEQLDEDDWQPEVEKYGLDCFVREWCRPDEFYEENFLPWEVK